MSKFVQTVEDDAVYSRLRGVLDDSRLILFAGAGLSRQALTDDGRSPPLWSRLLTDMLAWCVAEQLTDEETAQEITQLVDGGFLLEAGQELEDILAEISDRQRCLSCTTLCNEARVSDAHRVVADLPFRCFLTTNYDNLLELAFYEQRGTNLPKFYERTAAATLAYFMKAEPFVLKVHGDIDDGSIVLGTRAYDRLLDPTRDFRSCLQTMCASASVLFVGFGGTDPHVDNLLGRISSFTGRRKLHWMLAPVGAQMPLRRAKRLSEDRGVNVVLYPADDRHSQIAAFLERLAVPPTVPATAHTNSTPLDVAASKPRLEL